MPAVKERIRLCSNLLREPQVFDQLGELAGGIARDLILWAAWNNTPHAVLHLPQFCEMMGYDRRHLLRKVSEDQLKKLIEKGWHPEDAKDLDSAIGYTIGLMAVQLLLFAEPGQKANKSKRYTNKRMIKAVDLIEKRKTGTVIKFELDNEVIENCRHRYQTIKLEDYLSLKTPGGHPDDQARKVYLRLLWKRQYWDSQPIEKGIYPSSDNYTELLYIAGLDKYSNDILAASKLRAILKRIGALESIRLKPNVKLNYSTGAYEVNYTRIKVTKKDTDKVAKAE